ncbi:MAG: ABC transporter permease [Ignavibacteriae bacterium]|nr:ABC transporter permease [Ignavibacteriota bacterium]
MKLVYLFKESLRGFSSAKVSTVASIITITLSLILIAVYFAVSTISNNTIQSLKDKVELEAFLQEDISPATVDSLEEVIKRIGGIKSLKFISKEEATRLFTEEYGSEMLDILESNPLPPSIRINTYDEYKTTERIDKIKGEIEVLNGVTDVYYQQENLKAIEKTSSGILFVNMVILIVITSSSVFLVSNTIRLVIYSKRKVIQTMKLLGATKNFIRLPYLFEGIIQGFLAGILAIILIILMVQYYQTLSKSGIEPEIFNFLNFLYLLLIGITLGLIGSSISIRRHLRENYKA